MTDAHPFVKLVPVKIDDVPLLACAAQTRPERFSGKIALLVDRLAALHEKIAVQIVFNSSTPAPKKARPIVVIVM